MSGIHASDPVIQRLPVHPVWMDTPLPSFGMLDRDLDVDVVIVGGGLTGITTAYLLRKAGVRIALMDRGRLASGDTGRSTAHLSYVTDERLTNLARRFGKDTARTYWQGGATAIDAIAEIANETGAQCDFLRCPGFLHAPMEARSKTHANKERDRLQRDAELARELGFAASFSDSSPYANGPGVRFENQARFHPRKYLAAMLQSLPGDDCHLFEQTLLQSVSIDPMVVLANGHRINCEYLVIATHNPVMGRPDLVGAALFEPRLELYTSYVLGAVLPAGSLPEAIFWDTADPYQYLRVDSGTGFQYLIFGGGDTITARQKDSARAFDKLGAKLHLALPEAQVSHRWMGQVVVTDDGLPFIGERASREFVATGFCGNGFTLGTLSAMMARDRFLARDNDWFDLFRIERPIVRSGWRRRPAALR